MMFSRMLWWRRDGEGLYQRDLSVTQELDDALDALVNVLAEKERRRRARRRRRNVVPFERRSGGDRRRQA